MKLLKRLRAFIIAFVGRRFSCFSKSNRFFHFQLAKDKHLHEQLSKKINELKAGETIQLDDGMGGVINFHCVISPRQTESVQKDGDAPKHSQE